MKLIFIITLIGLTTGHVVNAQKRETIALIRQDDPTVIMIHTATATIHFNKPEFMRFFEFVVTDKGWAKELKTTQKELQSIKQRLISQTAPIELTEGTIPVGEEELLFRILIKNRMAAMLLYEGQVKIFSADTREQMSSIETQVITEDKKKGRNLAFFLPGNKDWLYYDPTFFVLIHLKTTTEPVEDAKNQ